ncbi:MAG: DUF3307 domain-containing protein [Chloroflexi bacterium]|jgi:hypothetical protein|nr:DUF3307 domain-containing protein [Anaerolineaceae bacterium]NLI44486.1 DUF3307 domain-containing protein [Chloroflexota bacterium]HOE34863.1 DUF3307 domain-containing protein [Anaerolineaceae bacterium]HOT25985.1 DUF3307 domain-containing protein [Anaerolineaceae bacterium]HQK04031.1 DUF3307 domain-containing protein [Anaerolineaceae bacterium]
MLKPLGVLILAHLLADFVLQPESLIALKLKKHKQGKFWNSGIFWHSVVHLAVSAALLILWGAWSRPALYAVGCAFAAHYLIDRFKSLWKFQRTWVFILDQVLHFAAIYLILLAFGLAAAPVPLIGLLVSIGQHSLPLSLGSKIAAGLAVVIGLVWVSGHLIKNILSALRLRPFETAKKEGEPAAAKHSAEKPGAAAEARAGMYIGYLERLLIGVFMVSGIYTGLGLLGTLKTLARFKQLESREITEYFILGTMLSMLLGMLFGALLRFIVLY